TLGLPLSFAVGISTEEQRSLVAMLRRRLAAMKVGGLVDGNGPWVVRPGATCPERPSDSRAQLVRGPHYVRFSWYGRWSLGAIVATTFLNLFWNGIVGLFALMWLVQFDLFLFVFLIPFEVIGLCLCALWLATLTAPAWRLSWVFEA